MGKMRQVQGDAHCYVHKGFSIKLVCGDDDTIRVNHWFDVTGREQPCTGKMLSEEPLIKELPWELAVRFINGECTWSSEHGAYAKLNVPLPSGGYPTCDFTGASSRRLTSGNNTNASSPGPSPPAQTPPANSNPTPAATPAASGANTGASGSNSSTATNSSANTTADPAASPTPAPPGVASGSLSLSAQPALIAAFCAVTLTTIVV